VRKLKQKIYSSILYTLHSLCRASLHTSFLFHNLYDSVLRISVSIVLNFLSFFFTQPLLPLPFSLPVTAVLTVPAASFSKMNSKRASARIERGCCKMIIAGVVLNVSLTNSKTDFTRE
jgi:hypothetical protein